MNKNGLVMEYDNLVNISFIADYVGYIGLFLV